VSTRTTRYARVWRGVLIALSIAVGLVLVIAGTAGADVFSNIGPAQQVSGGLFGQYPLGNYALDSHFSAVSVGVFSGVDVSGVPPMIAFFLANTIWQLTAFLANCLITVFTWAFSLDLLTGSATGGAGALAPVSSAVQTVYGSVFGAPWLVLAILLVGLWAMWKALVQRRYTETASSLGVSLVFLLIALFIVTQPQRTIGTVSGWTNQMSAAFLSLTDQGTLDSEQQAKQADADQLFNVLVYQPWVVLEFGGLEHCVTTGTSNSTAVQPLPASTSKELLAGTEVQVGGRTCINDANKYAAHFLRYAPASDDRNSEYQALSDGNSAEVPSSDPDKTSYHLGPADKPAAAAAGQGGQYERLLLALVILAGELGAFLLLGVLSVGVVLAQIVVLVLLGFAPVALVIGIFPGRGHLFFAGWLQRLAAFLLRKAIYSLVLAVLLAVSSALIDATSSLGWLLSFLLEAAFFWTVFLYRHQLTGELARATTGHDPRRDPTAKLASLYFASRLLRGGRTWHSTTPPPTSDTAPSGGGNDGGFPGEPSGPDGPEPPSPPAPPADGWELDEADDAQLGAGPQPVAQIESGPGGSDGPRQRPRLALPAPPVDHEDPSDPGDPGDPAAAASDQPPAPAAPSAPRPDTLDTADRSDRTAAIERDRDASAGADPELPAPQARPEMDELQAAGEEGRPVEAGKEELSLAERLRADRQRLEQDPPTPDTRTDLAGDSALEDRNEEGDRA